MTRTVYAKRNWFPYLQEHCSGSTGKGGSLIGMRRLYWGKDAYVVRCCEHLFRVSEDVFQTVANNKVENSFEKK